MSTIYDELQSERRVSHRLRQELDEARAEIERWKKAYSDETIEYEAARAEVERLHQTVGCADEALAALRVEVERLWQCIEKLVGPPRI